MTAKDIVSTPINNVDAWTLGEVCMAAASPTQKVGDPIDRGLILRRLLAEAGFALVKLQFLK